MTEHEWLTSKSPGAMLGHIEGETSHRKLRLFACGCCRQIWNELADARSRRTVEIAERYADGLTSRDELTTAKIPPLYAALRTSLRTAVNGAACTAEGVAFRAAVRAAASAAARAAGENPQFHILRDIIGNPFKPVVFQPHWRTLTILQLAQTMYDTRDFSAMPILGDALEEAGCEKEDMLAHCRDDGPHVRGCWVVDLILGKK